MKTKEELNNEELSQVVGGGNGLDSSENFDLFNIKENSTFISTEGEPNTITCKDPQR